MNEEQMLSIAERQARNEEQIKTLFQRVADIRELTETVQKLAIAMEKQATALQGTEKKVDAVRSDVDELKLKPARRWDSVTTLVITVIVTAVVTFALTAIGLK